MRPVMSAAPRVAPLPPAGTPKKNRCMRPHRNDLKHELVEVLAEWNTISRFRRDPCADSKLPSAHAERQKVLALVDTLAITTKLKPLNVPPAKKWYRLDFSDCELLQQVPLSLARLWAVQPSFGIADPIDFFIRTEKKQSQRLAFIHWIPQGGGKIPSYIQLGCDPYAAVGRNLVHYSHIVGDKNILIEQAKSPSGAALTSIYRSCDPPSTNWNINIFDPRTSGAGLLMPAENIQRAG
jgi:hypothetical protein